ncbi:MAG: serine hydrolase domain-containing protein [Gemmatimonadales bacterium]
MKRLRSVLTALSVLSVLSALSVLTALSVLSALSHPLHAQTDSASLAPAWRLIDRFAEQWMQESGAPGLAFAITDRTGTLRVATWGYADVEARRPLTPADRFEIGSISKSFTAIALLQLEAAGKFDPRQPITTYLPWFSIRSDYRPITGHDLLTHTAGFPTDRDDIPSSLAQAYEVRDRIAAPPGSYWSYSNVGYQVLGYVLGAIAGRPSNEVVGDRILAPLGMTSSKPQFTNADRPSLATGYVPLYDDRPRRAGEPLIPGAWGEYAGGDGAIISTPGDMATYARMLLNGGRDASGQLLPEKQFGELTARQFRTARGDSTWYGYGLFVERRRGHRWLWHTGGMIGYTSSLAMDLDAGLGAVALINGPGDPTEITDFAIAVLEAARHGDTLPALPMQRTPFSIARAAEYSGRYRDPAGRTLVFSSDGDRLLLDRDGRLTPLEAFGDDAVLGPTDSFALFPLQFRRPGGVVTEVDYGGDWYANDRYHGPKSFTHPEGWDAYVGHYRYMSPWESDFRIVERQGRLWYIDTNRGEEELTPIGPAEFRVGPAGAPDRLHFDQVLRGHALRATLSGVIYYRYFIP